MKDKIDLIKEIVKYRAKHNLSMQEFAEKCGTTLQTIWNIESGRSKPQRTTLFKIMEVINGENETV